MLRIYKENIYRTVTEEAYEKKWKPQGFEIREVQEGEPEKAAGNIDFAAMTDEELQKYAAEQSIPIPGNVTKREKIIEIILKHKQNGG